MELIFASQNKNKVREIKPLLPSTISLITLDSLNYTEEIPETGNTLEKNALQKARLIFETFHIPCFADDTGLEVEALGGEPGVYSARYAGLNKSPDDNIRKLLEELKGKKNRKATFRTVIALTGMGETKFFEGALKGSITEVVRGKSGFGYDPVFLPTGFTKTLAEMSLGEKNKISHRSAAIAKLSDYLKRTHGQGK